MKILQLNLERGWRGGERQTMYCMRQFRAEGHDVALMARPGGQLAKAARSEGFEVYEPAGLMARLGFLARTARQFDIIHAQTANTITWAGLTRWLHKRPVVFSRRTDFRVRNDTKIRLKWRCIDLFVAISESAAAEPRRLGFKPVIIRSAIEPAVIDQHRVQRFLNEWPLQGKRVIATSAALVEGKDPLTMIAAVHDLAQVRDDFVFVHFGGGGNAEQAARARVAELGLENTYLFAGFQEDIESLYSVMDVFAMSSVDEALGSSVLDAFLQRVPVVSTDAGGLKESLAQDRGILCRVGDHKALAAGMQRLLDDTAFRTEAVEHAYAYVRREHDVERMGRRYLQEFERLRGSAQL
ncbi:glycosyltransferase family 4 protein [Pusillimonas sp. MFBS29]|uniref:glycosyltransferase family 4 protein n=1 Tax=Pusillimonas sp. MFBS29 TaxID=2886690 RepID=UPI001D101313|nr:glycosyltransferase family 4 protein [Pusillimonas sp. MFBS29]MCC2595927.1 glycosyltransferase family 4 protein [Pusillimonas sp. MFBS29]